MIPLRYAAFLAGATTLVCIAFTPNSPASIQLVGLFICCFGTVAWTCRERKTRRRT